MISKIKRLYIIYGGPSSEREVSFSSKDYFLKLYEDQNPILVEWLEDFSFKIYNNPQDLETTRCHPEFISGSHTPDSCHPELVSGSHIFTENDFYKYLSKQNCIAIIAGHGEYIEDGYIQEKLYKNRIEYTGSSPESCELAMDKIKSQRIAKKFIKTVPTYASLPNKFLLADMQKKIGTNFPIFLKPNARGSSVGCYIAQSHEELGKLIKGLPDIEYIFQPLIEGVEVSIGSVRDGDNFLKLSPTEIRPKFSTFFDWDSKYKEGGSEEITPCTLGGDFNQKVCDIANEIHNKLGLGYYSRADFIYSKNGELYYLETNTYPGMSKTSLVPQQLRYSHLEDEFKKGLIKWTIKKS